MGFTALKEWLRHRHPMILLDRILDYRPGESLTALVAASGGLDFMAGHFPDRAIYPGSHLIQAFAQSGIILFQLSTTKLQEDEVTVIGSVEARFFHVIVPGDRVEIHATVERLSGRTFWFSGKALVDGKRVAAFRASLVRAHLKDMGAPAW